jgi:hypothetical protein
MQGNPPVIDKILTVRHQVPAQRSVLVAVSGIDGSGRGYRSARLVLGAPGQGGTGSQDQYRWLAGPAFPPVLGCGTSAVLLWTGWCCALYGLVLLWAASWVDVQQRPNDWPGVRDSIECPEDSTIGWVRVRLLR